MGWEVAGQALLPAAESCRVSVLEPRGPLKITPHLMDEGERPREGGRQPTQDPRARGSSSGKPRASWEKGRDMLAPAGG